MESTQPIVYPPVYQKTGDMTKVGDKDGATCDVFCELSDPICNFIAAYMAYRNMRDIPSTTASTMIHVTQKLEEIYLKLPSYVFEQLERQKGRIVF